MSGSRSGPDKEFIEDYDARIKVVRLNVLRRAFDSGTFSFKTTVLPNHSYELPLRAVDFQPQKKAGDETIRRFIKFSSYCLGFKHRPNAPNVFVEFDAADLEYLGAKSEDIGRNVRLLTEEGYLRSSSVSTFANPLRVEPTAPLIREFETRDDLGSSSLTNDSNPYRTLSDDRLREMLADRKIKPKHVVDGRGERYVYDRAHAIAALLRDDRPEPPPAPTYSTVINVHDSNVIHSSPGASITQTIDFKSGEFRRLLDDVKQLGSNQALSEDSRAQIAIDIGTIELQAKSARPNVSVIRSCMESVKTILENAAGTLAASGVLAAIKHLFP